MLTFLFLVALLLAIPTYGLSLLAYFGLIVARAILLANARMQYANTQQAYRDVQKESSKTLDAKQFENGVDSIDELFWYPVIKICERKGIPQIYTRLLIIAPDFSEMFGVFIKSLERNGSSVTARQIASAEFIENAWNRLDDDQKTQVLQHNRLISQI